MRFAAIAPRMASRTEAAARSTSDVNPGPEIDVAGDDAEKVGLLPGGFEDLAAERESELVGGDAAGSARSSRRPKTTVPGGPSAATASTMTTFRACRGRSCGDVIFGDVLGIDQGQPGPGGGLADGLDDPGPDAVVAAQRISHADEAGRLAQEVVEADQASVISAPRAS